MFNLLQQIQPTQTFFNYKRYVFHQSRATEQRDKIKKTIRFKTILNSIISRKSNDYQFVLQKSIEQTQNILLNLMKQNDLISLMYCISNLRSRVDYEQILTSQFLKQFIQFSQNLFHQPEIILIYLYLSDHHERFYKVVFESPLIIKNMTKQLQKLKSGFEQNLYLQTLQNLSPHYPKHFEQQIRQLFDTFSQLIENETVDFDHGLKILKSISPYINISRNFSISTIERLLTKYEQQSQCKQVKQSKLTDIFIVLTKIIYYQQNIDIVTNWRLMKMLIHAKQNLSAKVIQEYYDVFILLAKLIQKTGNYQIKDISKQQFLSNKKLLLQTYQLADVNLTQKQLYLTTIIINDILYQYRHLLQAKYFHQNYLHFILTITKYTSTQILLKYFIKSDFIQYLTECIDHINLHVTALSLDIFLELLDLKSQKCQTYQIIKSRSNLRQIVQDKLHRTENKVIAKKANLLLEKIIEFQGY